MEPGPLHIRKPPVFHHHGHDHADVHGWSKKYGMPNTGFRKKRIRDAVGDVTRFSPSHSENALREQEERAPGNRMEG